MVRNRVGLVSGLACLALLGGCGSLFGGKSCHKPQVYEEAESLPPLQIPLGLDPMDTRGALKIPDLKEPEAPRAKDGPCLEEPPQLVTTPVAPSATPAAVPSAAPPVAAPLAPPR
jgi:uncharacterized lipoprotein